MQNAMTLEQLLTEVQRTSSPETKRDFTTTTQDNIRLVPSDIHQHGIAAVLLRNGATELERFGITDNAHSQIAAKMDIPSKFYQRLLRDHADMVIHNVNALFEREPKQSLVRVLDGNVRAFLSDRYRALDNQEVLCNTLPSIVKGELETTLLGSNVTENYMNLKVLFTGDELAHEITKARGEARIIKPGFRLSNSEVGRGSLKIETFFFDSYCTNGCVWGVEDAFSFSRSHVGGRLIEGVDFQVVSDDSRELADKLIISQVNDAMKAISNPENVAQMADKLRQAANSPVCKEPVAAVEKAVKELGLNEKEKDSILNTFLRDQDFSKWGLASAITEAANKSDVATYDRANDLEEIGGKVLAMPMNIWNGFVTAERVAA